MQYIRLSSRAEGAEQLFFICNMFLHYAVEVPSLWCHTSRKKTTVMTSVTA